MGGQESVSGYEAQIMGEEFIQVGYAALRNPATGDFLPAVPLYIKTKDGGEAAEAGMLADFGKLMAKRIKAYRDGCRKAGVQGA